MKAFSDISEALKPSMAAAKTMLAWKLHYVGKPLRNHEEAMPIFAAPTTILSMPMANRASTPLNGNLQPVTGNMQTVPNGSAPRFGGMAFNRNGQTGHLPAQTKLAAHTVTLMHAQTLGVGAED